MRLDQQQNKIQIQAKTIHYDIASAALNKSPSPWCTHLTAEPSAMGHALMKDHLQSKLLYLYISKLNWKLIWREWWIDLIKRFWFQKLKIV